MVTDFQEAVQAILSSKEYETFSKEYPSYYLVHGFVQLNKEFAVMKDWQIGFYSKEKDNLAVFETNPLKQLPFEDAFKDGGTIDKLPDYDKIIKTQDALDIVKQILQEEHSHELPNTYIVIVQVHNGTPVYNITVVTAAFAMITIHINAHTKAVEHKAKRSILDLQKKQ